MVESKVTQTSVPEQEEAQLEQKIKDYTDKPLHYYIARYVQCFCIAVFIFGTMWNGTEILNLSTPQFMMLYGGGGAVICEVLARLFDKKKE